MATPDSSDYRERRDRERERERERERASPPYSSGSGGGVSGGSALRRYSSKTVRVFPPLLISV